MRPSVEPLSFPVAAGHCGAGFSGDDDAGAGLGDEEPEVAEGVGADEPPDVPEGDVTVTPKPLELEAV